MQTAVSAYLIVDAPDLGLHPSDLYTASMPATERLLGIILERVVRRLRDADVLQDCQIMHI